MTKNIIADAVEIIRYDHQKWYLLNKIPLKAKCAATIYQALTFSLYRKENFYY